MYKKYREALSNKKGFTLIEILIVLGIIVVLALAILYGIRPVERIKDARDSQRVVHSQALWKAITQKIYDGGGGMARSKRATNGNNSGKWTRF